MTGAWVSAFLQEEEKKVENIMPNIRMRYIETKIKKPARRQVFLFKRKF